IVSGLLFGPDAEPDKIEGVSSGSLAAYLFASTILVLASGHLPVALVTYVVLVGATIAIAWRAAAATAAVAVPALLTFIVFVDWALEFNFAHLIAPAGPTAPAIPGPALVFVTWHLVLGALFAGLFGGSGFLAQGRSERPEVPMVWSASAVFATL